MSAGKIAVSMLVLATVLTALAVWYLQVYGFYEEIDELSGADSMLVTRRDGSTHPLAIRDFRAIDKSSSPIGYRACFTVDPADLADAQPFEGATPLVGPGWFKCFNDRGITADLDSGVARAVLGQAEIHADVDRVIAVYPDGRAFAWQQLNDKTPERGVMD